MTARNDGGRAYRVDKALSGEGKAPERNQGKNRVETVADSQVWLTEDCRQALDQIDQEHHAKKRLTVILMAQAFACNESDKSVFERPDTCDEGTWIGRWVTNKSGVRRWKTAWRDTPEIAAALKVCQAAALLWHETETVQIEGRYALERRRKIAKHAAAAPDAIARVMFDPNQKGADVTNAAMKLIGLADPQASGAEGVYAPVGGSIEQVNTNATSIDIKPIDYRTLVAPLATGPDADRAAPGEGESANDGATLGEDRVGRSD